jgi:hypothetical protein
MGVVLSSYDISLFFPDCINIMISLCHASARTRKAHMPHLDSVILQVLEKLLALRRFASAVETFEDYEFAPRHCSN